MTMLDSLSSVYVPIVHVDVYIDEKCSCRAVKVIYPLIAAIGLGCIFQVSNP